MTDLEVELLNDEIVALKREEQQLLFLKAELEEKVSVAGSCSLQLQACLEIPLWNQKAKSNLFFSSFS